MVCRSWLFIGCFKCMKPLSFEIPAAGTDLVRRFPTSAIYQLSNILRIWKLSIETWMLGYFSNIIENAVNDLCCRVVVQR